MDPIGEHMPRSANEDWQNSPEMWAHVDMAGVAAQPESIRPHNRIQDIAHRIGEEFAKDPEGTAILSGDLDGLKAENSAHGHSGGDQLLEATYDVLSHYVRKDAADITDDPDSEHPPRLGDVVAIGEAMHASGDEFWLVLHGIHSRRDLETAAERLTEALDSHGISMSFGGIRLTPDQDIETAMKQADALMEQNKVENKLARLSPQELAAYDHIIALADNAGIDLRDIGSIGEAVRARREQEYHVGADS